MRSDQSDLTATSNSQNDLNSQHHLRKFATVSHYTNSTQEDGESKQTQMNKHLSPLMLRVSLNLQIFLLLNKSFHVQESGRPLNSSPSLHEREKCLLTHDLVFVSLSCTGMW